jgi:hypothetical protein
MRSSERSNDSFRALLENEKDKEVSIERRKKKGQSGG